MKSNAKTQRLRHAGVVCVVLLGCWGCEQLGIRKPVPASTEDASAAPSEPEPAQAEESAEPPEPPGLTPAEATRVERLLARADQAIEDDHLTYPSQGSALALYDEVAILDPDNEQARRGLERIVERYLELADSAAEQGRFSNAQAMLDRARLVDPKHPGITPATYRIDMLATADRQLIKLDATRVRDQDPALAETLHQAGLASRRAGCRAQITARSDSEGRWIYQRMSEGPGSERIQAQLDIGAPPRIEVLCFPESQ